MIYTFRFLGRLFFFITRFSRFIPAGLAGLYVIINAFYVFFTKGLTAGFSYLATTFLAAEYTIHQNVELAIINSPSYTLNSFLQIVSSVFILFWFIKFVALLFIKISGSQAEWGAMVMASLFVFVIELSVVKIVSGSFGFIPLYDGLFFLLKHLPAVITNIHYL